MAKSIFKWIFLGCFWLPAACAFVAFASVFWPSIVPDSIGRKIVIIFPYVVFIWVLGLISLIIYRAWFFGIPTEGSFSKKYKIIGIILIIILLLISMPLFHAFQGVLK
jgi:hypothetical protein